MDPEIREAAPGDGEGLLELKLALDSETELMMLEPGERVAGLDVPDPTVFVAEEDGRLAGYVEAQQGCFRRNRHSAYVVLGVRESAGGRGIGRRLLEQVEEWARKTGVSRLELTVMAHNERALCLYERLGYELEGRRRRSLRVDGRYVDELALAKLLD